MTILYVCPQCLYENKRKSSMAIHFKRKTPCPFVKTGVELTDEIKNKVLMKQYVPIKPLEQPEETSPQSKKEATNTIIHNHIQYYINNGTFNILTDSLIASKMNPLISSCGQNKITNNRLTNYPMENLCTSDIYKLTDRITQSKDKEGFIDAYYSYDNTNHQYFKRIDNGQHEWVWQVYSDIDIMKDIITQLNQHVMSPYDLNLNKKCCDDAFKFETQPITEFYKICRYLQFKPLCCSATYDSQLIYNAKDVEYYDNITETYVLDTLKNIYDKSKFLVDLDEMIEFRNEIANLLKKNGQITFETIKQFICSELALATAKKMNPC